MKANPAVFSLPLPATGSFPVTRVGGLNLIRTNIVDYETRDIVHVEVDQYWVWQPFASKIAWAERFQNRLIPIGTCIKAGDSCL
jgi:hypothetical protein